MGHEDVRCALSEGFGAVREWGAFQRKIARAVEGPRVVCTGGDEVREERAARFLLKGECYVREMVPCR